MEKIIHKETWGKTILEFDAISRLWITQPDSLSFDKKKRIITVERKISVDDINGFIKALQKAKKLLKARSKSQHTPKIKSKQKGDTKKS